MFEPVTEAKNVEFADQICGNLKNVSVVLQSGREKTTLRRYHGATPKADNSTSWEKV
jgi:hypothetical protein